MVSNVKAQRVYVTPMPPPPKAEERIDFRGADRMRAQERNVPTEGRIEFVPPHPSAAENEIPVMLCTSGYDGPGVAADVTGFISGHDVNIKGGYGATMMGQFQGEGFLFAVDPDQFKRIEEDLPTFEEEMNQRHPPRAQPRTPSRRWDATFFVFKDGVGYFCKASTIMAKYGVNIRSMMGGPYKPDVPPGPGCPPPPEDWGAIVMEVDIPVDREEEIVRSIREEMEAEPDWFFAMKEHDGDARGSGRAGGGERPGAEKPTSKAAGGRKATGRVKRPSRRDFTVEAEHFGP